MKKITFLILFLTITFSFAQNWSTGVITFNGNYSGQVDVTPTTVTLTLIGPDDRWLGMGFGVTCMTSGNDDVVIFDGTNLTDRNYIGIGVQPAVDFSQDWTIISNTTSVGTRTLIATRARDTGDSNDFVFPAAAGGINFVWAYRGSAGFSITSHSGNRGSVSASLGIDDFKSHFNFKIFPNPVTTEFKVDLPNSIESANIDVFDILGKQIYSMVITSFNSVVEVSNWDNGTYLVRVSSGEYSQTKRIIKQ